MRYSIFVVLVLVAMFLGISSACGERIKDIADIQGVRGNPILGYGLVVGLSGTGDSSTASQQALSSILGNMGLVIDPRNLSSENIASVVVTAQLPPFGRKGSTIDVAVSAFGDASSLQGGTLLMTPLLGADKQPYAVASGSITVGGFLASGQEASVTKNHTTVGRIPGGATIEKEEIADWFENGLITFNLHNPDFATAGRVAKAINSVFPNSSSAEDAGTVSVMIPKKLRKADLTDFVTKINSLEVKVDMPALVVINERTGTIVVGQNVGVSMVAITHGSLTIVTEEKDFVSQPLPFSEKGKTDKMHRTELQAIEGPGSLHIVPRQVSVSELARAFNAMGLTPTDLIAIFQALRDAGALQARLKIM